MKYYGFMVCELDGDIENLEVECEYKPPHESCGFSFAKWFKTEPERDKCKEYINERIQYKRYCEECTALSFEEWKNEVKNE